MAKIKATKRILNKVEDIFAESDYHLRYEKGSFKSGFCVLKSEKIIIVNKYYPVEGKLNVLIDILKNVQLNTNQLTDKNKQFLKELLNEQLTL